jgi:L-rhamnose isomerase
VQYSEKHHRNCELIVAERDPKLKNRVKQVALMVDQNHNLQNQIEGLCKENLVSQGASYGNTKSK